MRVYVQSRIQRSIFPVAQLVLADPHGILTKPNLQSLTKPNLQDKQLVTGGSRQLRMYKITFWFFNVFLPILPNLVNGLICMVFVTFWQQTGNMFSVTPIGNFRYCNCFVKKITALPNVFRSQNCSLYLWEIWVPNPIRASDFPPDVENCRYRACIFSYNN